MIIKKKDSKESEMDELSYLLGLNLPSDKKFLIKRELNLLKSGEKGEKDSIYYIDFDLGSSKRWAVIHDLRLGFDNQVAQIDHLLINRLFEFYVLESKNFSNALKITNDGEFLRAYDNKYKAIPSPIEQNRRHIVLLEEVIKTYSIMPTRLGIQMSPAFKSYILIHPESRVIRPSKFDTSMVIKADALRSQIDKEIDNFKISDIASVAKFSSFDTVVDVARKLAKLHKPIKVDYRSKFLIGGELKEPSMGNENIANAPPCPKCGADMVLRTAKKGSNVGSQFWGCSNFPKCRAKINIS